MTSNANNGKGERIMASLADQIRQTKDMTEAEKEAWSHDEMVNSPCYHCTYLEDHYYCTFKHKDANCVRDIENS